jgi:NAD(P)H-dependent FMN reductase
MRTPSLTRDAIEAALEGVRVTGAQTQLVDIAELSLPFCDGREDENTYPSDVQEFRSMIRDSHGIIIGTPEYHNSMTGALKNAIDLCSAADFEHKMVGLIGVAGGAMGAINAIDHLRTVMRGLGAWVVPHQVSVANAVELRGSLADEAIRARLGKLGTDVARFAKLMATGVINIQGMHEV